MNIEKLKAWESIKHFTYKEFDSPDEKESGLNMNIEFIHILDKIRDICGFSLKVNSGYRTERHNAEVGGKPNSAHCNGVAVDFACTDSHKRYCIVGAAYDVGITRIEPRETWVHLDMDFTKPQRVMFFK